MFDFEKLSVYTKAKQYNRQVSQFLENNNLDRITHDQLRRAAFSIMLNIAEGSGRFTAELYLTFYYGKKRTNIILFQCN